MKRSTIYNNIEAEARKSDPSFGASGGFTQDIRVGWGKNDSHTLAKIEITESWNKAYGCKTFGFWVNGELIREAMYFGKGNCKVDWVW